MRAHGATRPYRGMSLPHWTFEKTMFIFGVPNDAFCIKRRYHAIVTKDVSGDDGWHLSIRPYCSEENEVNPTKPVDAEEWYPDVLAFFGLVGVKWDHQSTSVKGVVPFHERIGS